MFNFYSNLIANKIAVFSVSLTTFNIISLVTSISNFVRIFHLSFSLTWNNRRRVILHKLSFSGFSTINVIERYMFNIIINHLSILIKNNQDHQQIVLVQFYVVSPFPFFQVLLESKQAIAFVLLRGTKDGRSELTDSIIGALIDGAIEEEFQFQFHCCCCCQVHFVKYQVVLHEQELVRLLLPISYDKDEVQSNTISISALTIQVKNALL
ncbi:hypothetical protein AGLY_010964 [Aphis glycines]|uniref:Uncharacterized protein n=1 Tax=Aphis glycines TaxID=307491 RepID=A0A6G0TCH9_APHGL|nr:hypothetical protein AGLY_010964 [Aphis glycines]